MVTLTIQRFVAANVCATMRVVGLADLLSEGGGGVGEWMLGELGRSYDDAIISWRSGGRVCWDLWTAGGVLIFGF